MTPRKTRWLIGIAIALAIFFASTFVAGRILLRRLDPMVREQAVRYLHNRFHAQVELAALHVQLPHLSTMGLVFRRQARAIVQVDGEGLSIRRPEISAEPLLAVDKLHFTVDVASVLEARKKVDYVMLQGVRMTLPPKEDTKPGETNSGQTESGKREKDKPINVEIKLVDMRDATLVIVPKDKTRSALKYRIDRVRLTPVGPDSPLKLRRGSEHSQAAWTRALPRPIRSVGRG